MSANFEGDYRAAFKGEHLQAADFDKPYTMVIDRLAISTIEEANRKKKEKLTLWLRAAASNRPIERGWLISKTAAVCLAAMFGNKTAEWRGKRVTLYQDPSVRFADDVTGGIRVLGSPDIKAPIRVRIAFKKKKPYAVMMKVTEVGKEQLPTADDFEPDTGVPIPFGDEAPPPAATDDGPELDHREPGAEG